MTDLTKRQRIQAALAGEAVDRVPVGFWRHWPGDDQRAETLAAATLAFQQLYDLDFIKVPVSSAYCVNDYGMKHAYQGSLMGDRQYFEPIIKNLDDWDSIETLDISRGMYGEHLRALSLILERKESDTPVIFTMFNPLTMASYLAGEVTFLAHLRREPERVEHALKALTETCGNFGRAVIERGCDGIFLSTRFASYELMSSEEYQQFGRPSDIAVLQAASNGWFNVLHLHGQHPMFVSLADYPVHAINWHDRTAWPGLTEAGWLFSGTLMAGVEQFKTLYSGSTFEVQDQVYDAIRQMNGRRLIVTPGCTYPIDVPYSNLMAVRRAVDLFVK